MSYNISTKLLNTEQPDELSHLSGFVHMERIMCPYLPKPLVIKRLQKVSFAMPLFFETSLI